MNYELINEDFEDIRPERIASLIIADPPYGGIVKEKWDSEYTAKDAIRQLNVLSDWCDKPGASCYWFGGWGKFQNRVLFETLAKLEFETPWRIRAFNTWAKKRAYGIKDNFLLAAEFVIFLVYLQEHPHTFNKPYLDELRGYEGYNPQYPALDARKRRTCVWTDFTELLRGKTHPCEKPQPLIEMLIQTSSNEGDTVLSPFAGSGVDILAALRLNRKCIAFEVDEDYYAAIQRKL